MNNTNYKIALQSKEWFMDALFDLMKKYSYDSITISQLCRKADLSRRTFYRLFHSKEDVLDAKLHLLILEFLTSLPQEHPLGYMDMADSYFKFCYQHKEYLLILKHCNLLHTIFSKLQASIPEICKQIPRTDNEVCHSHALPLINAFGLGGLNTMLLEWITHDMSESPSEMTQALHLFLESATK